MNLIDKLLRRQEEIKLFLAMFPKNLSKTVLEVTKIIPIYQNPYPTLNSRKAHNTATLVVNNEIIYIPYRIPNDEPTQEKIKGLSDEGRVILYCIYSMHYDGYKREAYLRNIISCKEPWVIPFVIKALGDYVFEITKLIEVSLSERKDLQSYRTFTKNNKKYWDYLQSRSISYWDVFYRKEYKNYADIPTVKIAKLFKRDILPSREEYRTVKEKLLALIEDVLNKTLTFEAFSDELETYYWTDGVYDMLEEVDDDFFYRVYECSTYVDNEDANNWGLKSVDDYLKWLDKSSKEYLYNKNSWYKRVNSEQDMWA